MAGASAEAISLRACSDWLSFLLSPIMNRIKNHMRLEENTESHIKYKI